MEEQKKGKGKQNRGKILSFGDGGMWKRGWRKVDWRDEEKGVWSGGGGGEESYWGNIIGANAPLKNNIPRLGKGSGGGGGAICAERILRLSPMRNKINFKILILTN